MENELRDAIKLADRYIKAREYGLAWRTLRPYREHPDVEKRLIWLRKKHAQMQRDEAQSKATRKRSRPVWAIAVVGISAVALLIIWSLASNGGSKNRTQPTQQEMISTDLTAGFDTTGPSTIETAAPATPPNRDVTVTENPAELTVQEAAKQQLEAFDGVDTVISLDIDVPTDEAPLVYVEISVYPGNNTVAFVDNIMQALNGILNVTQYSDFDVIVSDDQQSIEYIYDPLSATWTITQLSN